MAVSSVRQPTLRPRAKLHELCLSLLVRLESNIGLIVAALDLKLVRLIRDAIADDPPGGLVASAGRSPQIEPRFSITPEAEFEPRRTIEPDPTIAPGRVTFADPRVEPSPTVYAIDESARPAESKNPFEPPWALLPWEQPLIPEPMPQPVVKVVRLRPDIVKGRLIDVMS